MRAGHECRGYGSHVHRRGREDARHATPGPQQLANFCPSSHGIDCTQVYRITYRHCHQPRSGRSLGVALDSSGGTGPCGGNGRHASLRMECLPACGFESRHGYGVGSCARFRRFVPFITSFAVECGLPRFSSPCRPMVGGGSPYHAAVQMERWPAGSLLCGAPRGLPLAPLRRHIFAPCVTFATP